MPTLPLPSRLEIGLRAVRVFITGITGTLGQAFADYLASQGHIISGVDHNEERIAAIRRIYPAVRLGDFGDETFVEPADVLIHLAAYKHIDLCETTPSSCVSNNVIKTFDLFHAAYNSDVDMLFMSTDKAVEPRSVYGHSKAIMESVALELGGAFARSGNILASNGSVLTIWERAIAQGKPLRLTHRDMRRYFITPENLARRIWDLYLTGEKVIIPEMDMDISLLELADQTLRKFGHSVDTYPIEFTGLRAGEKLNEELRWGTEK